MDLVAQYGAYFLFLYCLGSITYISIKNRVEIWEAFKGEDNKLQIVEVIQGVWIILFITVVLGELFFGLNVETTVWASMDIILLVTVGGRAILDKVHQKDKDNGN